MPTLGEKLRAARQAKQLTPQQVELETRIRAVVIEALEEEEFGNLPPPPFARGLLRNYARYLGLDPEDLLEEYAVASATKKSEAPPLENAPQPAVEPPKESELTLSEPEQIEIRPAPNARPSSEWEVPASMPESIPTEGTSELEAATPESVPEYAPRIPARRRIPISPEALAIAILAFVVLVLGYAAYTQLLGGTRTLPATQAASRATETLSVTATLTTTVESLPTPVPTFAATVPAALLLTPTSSPSVNVTRTLTTTDAGVLALSVETQQPIFLWVIADNQEVFKGILDAGVINEFTARERMYVQVKNIPNATIIGPDKKRIQPATFAERTVLERAWILNPRGTPIAIAPDAALTTPLVTDTPAPTSTPKPTPTETPAG